MMPNLGAWEPTPRWIFWQPTMRRRSWKLDGDMWLPAYEYQHPAFVAREILEERFASTDQDQPQVSQLGSGSYIAGPYSSNHL